MTNTPLWAKLTLASLILLFGLYFSWYTSQRYLSLNAYTADLSLIDQAMWNTLHGRFMEATWWNRQQPRTAEHFEPILIPLAGLFWLWDDVRIILIAQSFALAMGALPVFWLARWAFGQLNWSTHPAERLINGLALAMAALYLLSPPLQAAAVADFHADPFVVTPFLLTFWYLNQNRWGWAWFWASVMMSTKENMPTLVVMLGLYVLLRHLKLKDLHRPLTALKNLPPADLKHGLGLIFAGVTWFGVATFLIVAPLAETYFAADGPIYLVNRFSTNPLDWLAMLGDPVRLRYLGGLLLSVGGLALLAPQYLLLGLPIFVANTFSNFPGQYSGEQHYSAPLVAVLLIAAIFGLRNLGLWWQKRDSRPRVQIWLITLILAGLGLGMYYQTRYGWTPLSRRAESYAQSDHSRLLPRFVSQIPPQAIVSASAAVHPHLAHRPIAYVFPAVQNAEFILVDVLDVPGHHPNDIRAKIQDLLTSGAWTVLDSADGFILMRRQPTAEPQTLPDEFYSFARRAQAEPEHPLDVVFNEQIRLLGFSVDDEPFHQQTSLRFYWQALRPIEPDSVRLWPLFYDDSGQPLSDPRLQPSIESVWYPPARWQADEILITQTLPQNFGPAFHLALGISPGGDLTDPQNRWPSNTGQAIVELASFQRGGWDLAILPPQGRFGPLTAQAAEFEGGLRLTGSHWPTPILAGAESPLLLFWQLDAPLTTDYTTFIHILDQNGRLIAQIDTTPFWAVPRPTVSWPQHQAIYTRYTLPALPAGVYTLRLGWYSWPLLNRLPLINGGDTLELGPVVVE